jgi:IK cytokine
VVASIIDTPPTRETPQEPVPTADEDFDDNFDIFAGAGEYVGIEIDENEDDAETTSHRAPPHAPEVPSSLPQRWIAMDEPEHAPQSKPQIPLPVPKPEVATVAPDQEVEEQPIRLAPLESSSVPSIKQLLDMHDAADKYEKKLKRKEKKQRKRGGKGKGSDED